MLGETVQALSVTGHGIEGDRVWAAIDLQTGKVASAKRANLWRSLLQCEARLTSAAAFEVSLPGGVTLSAGDPLLDERLSALTGRQIALSRNPPEGAEVERSHPEAVLAEGLDVAVAYDPLRLGGGAPPGTFLDYAPIHLITSATLDGLIGLTPDDEPIEEIRYRANIVIRSPEGAAPFPENAWVGGVIRFGGTVALRVILPTPRCAIPALAHGALRTQPAALLRAIQHNRIEVQGFGNLPAAGVYLDVLAGGAITEGDRVTLEAA